MKRIWWLIPCLIVVLAFSATGCEFIEIPSMGENENSQETICILPQQNTGIWVTGQGEVMAVPDIASLRLGVEARADTVAEAQAEASEAMNKVMEALKDNGVAEEDIQTRQFSIYPMTRWTERKDEEEIIGYRVTNMVIAKIRDVDYESRPLDYRTGIIINAVAKAGGDLTRIQGITFSVDDPTPYYEEARRSAMENAKDKAAQLADLAGVELGKPTYISEGPVYRPEVTRYFPEIIEEEMAAPQPPISPGELKITVSVQVVYAIV